MSDEKVLTKEIAEQFVADEDSVDLSEFSAIEDAAAESLSKHKGDLWLGALTSLSDAAAESLSKYEGILKLDGLTELSDATAESLSKHKGSDLWLNGLTSLSDKVAESLVKYGGDLCLSVPTSLSDAAAESLSKHKGELQLSFAQVSNSAAAILRNHPSYAGMKVLYIAESIAKLSEQMCSESLSRLEGQGINFDEVLGQEFEEGWFFSQRVEYEDGHTMEVRIETSAGDVDWDEEEEATVCYSLFNKNGDDVCTSTGCYSLLGEYNVYDPENETRYRLDVRIADGLYPPNGASAAKVLREGNKLTKEIAEQWVADEESVDLSEFATIEDAAAESLSKYQGELDLDGLTSLSDAAAESLSKHDGNLFLDGLTDLSDDTAESLSRVGGWLTLNGLTNLSDAATESLGKCQHELNLNGVESLSDAAAESLRKHTGPLIYLEGLMMLSDAAAEQLSKYLGALHLFPHNLPASAAKILRDAGHGE